MYKEQSILFCGDVFIGGICHNQLDKISINSKCFQASSKIVFNLEGPLSSDDSFADKSVLTHTEKQLKRFCCSKNLIALMANNHIHDAGLDGLVKTQYLLQQLQIPNIGAGINVLQASKSLELEDFIILNYCDTDRPYLKDVKAATNNEWGINKLTFEKIQLDLDKINYEKKVIICIHWGAEHIFLPPIENVDLMKKLLCHDKVFTVIGNHAHRIQGHLLHNGKFGYFCQGNFFFSDFIIEPPIVSKVIDNNRMRNCEHSTYQYLKVYKSTLKKWDFIRRLSLSLLVLPGKKIKHVYMIRSKCGLRVNEVGIFYYLIFNWYLKLISMYFLLPRNLYKLIYNLVYKSFRIKWKLLNRIMHLRQLGLYIFTVKIFKRIVHKEFF